MLIRITPDKYLNADYILGLYLVAPDNLIQLKGQTVSGSQTYKIAARMIDNSMSVLLELKTQKEAELEFDRLIHESNKRLKRLEYEGD